MENENKALGGEELMIPPAANRGGWKSKKFVDKKSKK